MVSSGLLRRVALVRTEVSEEPGASFIRVTKIGALGTTQAETSTDEGGARFLRNVGSYKSHTAKQPRRHHSSGIIWPNICGREDTPKSGKLCHSGIFRSRVLYCTVWGTVCSRKEHGFLYSSVKCGTLRLVSAADRNTASSTVLLNAVRCGCVSLLNTTGERVRQLITKHSRS
jgi:hypothetical protein